MTLFLWSLSLSLSFCLSALPTKKTAAQNKVALSYHSVRGLCFLAVVSVATIYHFAYFVCISIHPHLFRAACISIPDGVLFTVFIASQERCCLHTHRIV